MFHKFLMYLHQDCTIAILIFMYRLFFIILFFCLAGVVNAQYKHSLADTIPLVTITGKQIKFYPVKKLQVVIFLSIDCPLSQKYTRTLNELSKTFASNVSFYGVFPDTTSSMNDYSQFQKKYEIPFELILDKNRKLTKALKAQITPECFMISEGKILYHGAIDDWVVGLGKTKAQPKIQYLQNAITDVLSGRNAGLDYKKPIGCYID